MGIDDDIRVPSDKTRIALEQAKRISSLDKELLNALELAREYVYSELETLKTNLAGYPHKWSREEADLLLIDSVIAKAHEEI